MARKRRGPGRPPKQRGPGRPPGSKNKTKKFYVKDAIMPDEKLHAELAEQYPPKRKRGRPRKELGDAPSPGLDDTQMTIPLSRQIEHLRLAVESGPSKQDIASLATTTQQFFERCEMEWAAAKENTGGIVRRLRNVEDKLREIHDDSERPDTRTLARRLIALESNEKATRFTHERISDLQRELNLLRSDLNALITEQQDNRNFDDVVKLAAAPDGKAAE